MIISILGTGNMGKALVKEAATHVEHQVFWGSRNPSEAADLAKGIHPKPIVTGTYEEALEGELIIPAIPAAAVMEWAIANKEKLKHKIIVDITNPFNSDFSGFTTAWGESSAERLQSLLPESKVVGAFKNTFFKVFDNPIYQGQKSDVLVTGDDDESVRRFMGIFDALPFRFIHAGKLANNRTIERFTLLELELAIRYGTYPYISLQVFGIEEAALAH